MGQENLSDPLAHASETPDIAALIQEFDVAKDIGLFNTGRIAEAEDVRFNRWAGKSSPPDGCRWQKNAAQGQVVRPYDGRPDLDVNLADEICNAEVDIDMTALAMAQLGADTTHVTQLTAQQQAELTAVARWVKKALRRDLKRGAELLSQMKTELGWCVLNPNWCERWGLFKHMIDMEDIINAAAKAPPGSVLSTLPQMILDPAMDDSTIALAQEQFGHMDKAEARRVVRELREQGHTEFMDRRLEEKRPSIRVLIPGYNFFVSATVDDLQNIRGALLVERFYQAEIEQMGKDNDWNKEFTAAVINTMGTYSVYGERLRVQQRMTDAWDKGIEIWTTFVRQYDEDTGASGIYCTTFSPNLKPGGRQSGTTEMKADPTDPMYFAKHYLLDYAHGQYPFCQVEREVTGPSLDDSRGVPELVRSDQKGIKNLQDALAARAHLEVDPSRVLVGMGWSKVKTSDVLRPGGLLENAFPGADVKDLSPGRGSPAIGEAAIERIERGTSRRFALPNATDGSHPAQWQMRQMRNSKRWLQCWEEAFWQLTVLTYQELDPSELFEIIGHWPMLTVEDLLKHHVTLSYDARALDQKWSETVLDFVIKLLGIDSGGLMDRGPIIQIALSMVDPTIAQGIMKSPAGASAALYRQVDQDIASIMLGNPPQLRENDASSGMQAQMAMAIIGKNRKYQMVLQQDKQVQEALKTYMDNLQHNVQETQISPQQGRLGVQTMPQRPVQRGMAALPESVES